MIKTFIIEGLNGNRNVDISFHRDINIITGRNGSGKTNILKLLWYLISANVERIYPEISVGFAKVELDEGSIAYQKEDSEIIIQIQQGNNKVREFRVSLPKGDDEDYYNANRLILEFSKQSIFFPTFRRIEGGFSMTRLSRADRGRAYRQQEVEEAITSLSNDLSVRGHRFVSSLSTKDIGELLQVEYANLSERTTNVQRALLQSITSSISNYKESTADAQSQKLQDAEKILDDIQENVVGSNRDMDALLKPFTALAKTVESILRYNGISFSENVTIGDVRNALVSDTLSAGEKQMLSFLSYNSFLTNTSVFIDEPEISLHIDWQRILFPTLLSQASSNQFIVATHSPFMYTSFPEKEIPLSDDRGGVLH